MWDKSVVKSGIRIWIIQPINIDPMTRSSILAVVVISCLLTLTIILSACSSFSLAEDILPPPGARLPEMEPTPPGLTGPLYPLVPPNPVAGESIYLENCAPCHGDTGRGDGPQANQLPVPAAPLGSAEIARQSTPSEWFEVVTQGNLERFMPPFTSLSARHRWDVLAYVYTLSMPPGMISLGGELFLEDCAACHGDSGQGDGPNAGNMSTSLPDFTNQAFMADKSAEDLFQAIDAAHPPPMSAFEKSFGTDERWSLVAYIRSLTFAIPGERAALPETPTQEPQSDPLDSEASEDDLITPGTGTVTGEVTNVSAGEIPAGNLVTLHGFDNLQETFTSTTEVQADGTFTFEDVELAFGRAYIISIEHQGARYGSDVAVVNPDTTSMHLPVQVFDTTTDASVLSIDRLHIFIDYQEPDVLQIAGLYIISNLSDRTVIPASEGEAVIQIDLPAGSANLQFEDGMLGGRYVQTARGFSDTAMVRPGTGSHQILFAYELPYQRNLDLEQKMTMAANAVVVLVPEEGLRIKSNVLQEAGARPVQGVSYKMYTSGRLEAGSQFTINISGRPRVGGASWIDTSSGPTLAIGLGALGAVLIFAGLWFYRQNRSQSQDDLDAGQEIEGIVTERLPDDPDTIMDAIIALDDLHKSGEIPQEAYLERRAELKEQLKELL
jgi:mono/diheme cytochrome c family protein